MAVSVEKAVIARLTKAGKKFEILVDPALALEVKAGRDIALDELLAVPEVYEDARKGLRAGAAALNSAFGTSKIEIIAPQIIRQGEVQLTTEQRRAMLEERTKAIAALLAAQGVDPRTGAPHPPERILRAMQEAKVRIDINKRAEEQVDAVRRAIEPIIPIKFERVEIAVKVPPEYAARAIGIVRAFGKPSKEEWTADGSYLAALQITAGMRTKLYERLNTLTRGTAQIKIIKKEGFK
jgi:ribosome maturation protein SDO1